MTLVLAALVFTTSQLILGAILAQVLRRQARERDRLINQICHLADKPWQPAPAREQPLPEVEPELPTLMMSPEQFSDDDLY